MTRQEEFRACSSGGLERTPDKREVESSSLSRPTMVIRGCSSFGRAPALHAGGSRFNPVQLHQEEAEIPEALLRECARRLAKSNR